MPGRREGIGYDWVVPDPVLVQPGDNAIPGHQVIDLLIIEPLEQLRLGSYRVALFAGVEGLIVPSANPPGRTQQVDLLDLSRRLVGLPDGSSLRPQDDLDLAHRASWAWGAAAQKSQAVRTSDSLPAYGRFDGGAAVPSGRTLFCLS